MILIYLPIHTRFYGNDENLDKIYIKIKNITKDLNIKLIDIVKYFKKIEEPNIYFAEQSNKHYNALGYNYISEIIFKSLD